jgi:hypothetical protein
MVKSRHWRERVNVVRPSIARKGHLLCDVDFFRRRRTTHQSLPSNLSEKLLAKLFLFCDYSSLNDTKSGVICMSKKLLALAFIWNCVGQVLTGVSAKIW